MMRGKLIATLAATLLLGGAAAPRPATVKVAECQSIGSADCAHLLQTLARFADAAYGDDQGTPPPEGFQPAELAGVALSDGRYTNGTATALVMTGQLDHAPVLVVGFGGSANPATWLADLRNIDAPYRRFLPLVRAVESYADAGGRVVLVGHSFGGTMVQLFMFAHPGNPNYRAVTFGSPGALPAAGLFAARADPRIANFVIADDPYAFLGEHRADVAAYAHRNPVYALMLASGISRESGLSLAQVLGSAPYLTTNYVNNGAKIVLAGRGPGLSVPTVVGADPDEHEIQTYAALFGSSAG